MESRKTAVFGLGYLSLADCQQPCVILPMIALLGQWSRHKNKEKERGESEQLSDYFAGDNDSDINTHNQSCNTAIIELHVNPEEKSFSITVGTSISDNDVKDITYHLKENSNTVNKQL